MPADESGMNAVEPGLAGLEAAASKLAKKVREHGARQCRTAHSAADEWAAWAGRLDKLVRSAPPLPRVIYMTEDGNEGEIELLTGRHVRIGLLDLLADALTRADALAAELGRHAVMVSERTADTLRELGEPS